MAIFLYATKIHFMLTVPNNEAQGEELICRQTFTDNKDGLLVRHVEQLGIV